MLQRIPKYPGKSVSTDTVHIRISPEPEEYLQDSASQYLRILAYQWKHKAEFDKFFSVFANIWVSGNRVLKALNGALNEDLQRLDYWLKSNKFSFNVFKTKSLLLPQKQKHFLESGEKVALEMRGRDIEAIPHIRYLGVYINYTLNWKNKSY